jgi:hypothetical protein
VKRAAPEEPPEDLGMYANLPPHNGKPTSIAAAESVVNSASRQRAQVYAFIAGRKDGATREEIEIALGLAGNAVRPRVWELLGNNGHAARIRESGERRRTNSGRMAEVLRIVQ